MYEKIAHHFSDTRHSPWPQVVSFLQELPDNVLVADVGCGNGKYLDVVPNRFMVQLTINFITLNIFILKVTLS